MMAPRTSELAFVTAACAWPRLPGDIATLHGCARAEIDWPLVTRLATTHQVTALVADALALVEAPRPARAALAQAAHPLLGEALRHAHETHRLVALLDAAGIPATVLKGAATAITAFGRQGLREAIDIDLLVAPDLVPPALATLLREGYHVEGDLRAARQRGHKDLLLYHPGRAVTLELHWRLFQNPRVLPVPTDRVPVAVLPGRDVPALAPLDEALYLCCHGGEHGWAKLKWLADITALLRAGRVDATALYAHARSRRLARMVGPGLLLAHRLHATPLPEALAADLVGDWRMRCLGSMAWSALAGDEDGLPLEQRPRATTLKNLSHYLFSADPRRLWHEARYDLLDRPPGQSLPRRLGTLATRLFRPRAHPA
ncbi:MAG: hypothetical protein RIS94_975 [Pseudomonadota bacterium]|jgi:hypothetical protein